MKSYYEEMKNHITDFQSENQAKRYQKARTSIATTTSNLSLVSLETTNGLMSVDQILHSSEFRIFILEIKFREFIKVYSALYFRKLFVVCTYGILGILIVNNNVVTTYQATCQRLYMDYLM